MIVHYRFIISNYLIFYLIGPALGSFLYTVGGFNLPFFVVGSVSLFLSFCLCLVIPNIEAYKSDGESNTDNKWEKKVGKKLTFLLIAKVIFILTLL